ncbi:MAG: DUF2905 domain-containing protein [Halanaerobiales bacterium]|nr:DUF2905 domain-containing protein [Halanaerobiales bacterium]
MGNVNWPKLFIYIGLIFVFFGVALNFLNINFNWFGNLPGDIKINKDNFKLYFPITSMLLITGLVNLIIYLFKFLIKF